MESQKEKTREERQIVYESERVRERVCFALSMDGIRLRQVRFGSIEFGWMDR